MRPAAALLVSLIYVAAAQQTGVESSVLTTEAVVNARVRDVWNELTTREGIESWMVAKTSIDLRPGGLWRTSYNKKSNLDDDDSIHHTILSYDPGRMLSYRTVKPPKDFPFPNALAKTWIVVYLEPMGSTQTKVTVRMLGYTGDEESQKMRAFFERGNKTSMDALVRRFEVPR